MKVKEIKDLIDFLTSSGLEEVNIETEEFKIKVKRSNDTQVIERTVAAVPAAAPAPAPVVDSAPAAAPAPAATTSNLIAVKSPMIGTFYRSANPDSVPFVEIGTKVSVGSPVCVIVAMKLFNEIESEISGTIVEILVDNATPVEYDQPLFMVDPS